ncbi:hypothetical protein MAC_06309 [Metarhizium acridum CQMa 102]|uniref:Sulfatase-modifying factor enzyme-like domain-containing protein n=1 Tax=Metarhizium acridum (strain CQMa 102) TaxID=655827 RepID=E9E8W1_METAQ|nr:uncharacterized protein MAC_06309 [Metarhizium acridum CQMa 102]EFY87597.1 hypothetical protein MAC_06309 [Metarhizium acridum CQMa 102]
MKAQLGEYLRVGSFLASFVATAGIVTAQSTNINQLRADLTSLVNTLRWNGTTQDTYAPVQQAALSAYSTLTSVASEHPKAIPQAGKFSETLERLIAESRYLVDLSAPADYEPSVLDSVMFLTGSVDEWRFAINTIGTKLELPSSYQAPQLRQSAASGINCETAPGTEFRDADVGPVMVVIPTGTFTAGSTPEEQELWQVPVNRRDFELPQRKVSIPTPLAIGKTEVTVDEFDTFVQETSYQPRGGARWWNPDNNTAMVFNEDLNYLNPGFPQTSDSPVVAITRQDVVAYAGWLSTITGATYRLPTEDEWEWAARGGSQDTFFWGNDIEDVVSYANSFDTTSKKVNGFRWANTPVDDGFAWTAPVASFRPNNFGLYDVTANAREFCADTWIRDLGNAAADGSVHTGTAPFPVVRGGAWNYQPQNLRINYRSAYFSSEVATNMFGFRLVREL